MNNLEDDIPDPEETGEEAEEGVQWFMKLRIVESVTTNHECTNLLKEISSEIYSSLQSSPTKRESWDVFCEKIAKDDYLAFVYTVVHLALFDFNEDKYRKLSLLTAQSYLLSLTIPGARACGVFDERIVRKIVKLCESVEKLRETTMDKYQMVEVQVSLINLMIYLQTFLKNISLDDCVLLKEAIIITMKNIILHFQKNAYQSICESRTRAAFLRCLDSHLYVTPFQTTTTLQRWPTTSCTQCACLLTVTSRRRSNCSSPSPPCCTTTERPHHGSRSRRTDHTARTLSTFSCTCSTLTPPTLCPSWTTLSGPW